jgi:hypothetical protein
MHRGGAAVRPGNVDPGEMRRPHLRLACSLRPSQLDVASGQDDTRYATRAAMVLGELLRALGQHADANWVYMKAHFQASRSFLAADVSLPAARAVQHAEAAQVLPPLSALPGACLPSCAPALRGRRETCGRRCCWSRRGCVCCAWSLHVRASAPSTSCCRACATRRRGRAAWHAGPTGEPAQADPKGGGGGRRPDPPHSHCVAWLARSGGLGARLHWALALGWVLP